MYGQAILDMATYKILMGTDGKNLEDTTELFKLSESQSYFLYAKKRAFALLIIGAYRILVKFDIFSYEFEYYGKSSFHTGIDLAGSWRSNVIAVLDGTVVFAGLQGGDPIKDPNPRHINRNTSLF